MAAPRIDGSRSATLLDTQANEAPRPLPGRASPPAEGHAVSRHPGRRALDQQPVSFVANDVIAAAPNVAEATKLANELAPSIAGRHTIEYRLVRLVRDLDGHVRRVAEQGTMELNLALPDRPTRVELSLSRSYGVTPALSTDAFGLSPTQAQERGVTDTARTMVHEWGHVAVNRTLLEGPDPKAAYERASAPIGLWESLSYKSPSTGEFVQVTPSGGGVSAHEMAGQYAGALFDKALAERKARRP
ncbi:MAG: hypothetical protein JNJ54_19725 [Myxococcaceae bacterium]|nr:hypothetical protein [Myxococcaceae bacterium]